MKKDISRCMGCMSEKLYSGPCEVCGYIENDAYPAGCLAPRTFLADRYVLGKLISKGGESAVYLAYDEKEGKTVEIREFLPDTLCRRGDDGETITVNDGSLPLFKSYLSEYADLHKTLMTSMEGSCLKKTFDIFPANGTGYVVTEHTDGVTLEEYLSQCGGVLTWGEASRMFPAVLDTLSSIHEKGIVHRGLSTETIMISKDGNPVLTSVEISAARTSDSQINCEMYPGYAACEQYDLSERQGSWTDVYGISAVLYRALTGKVPEDAVARKTEDTLRPAAEINEDIPEHVSEAIAAGMSVSRADRIPDIATLKARLYDEPEQITPAVPAVEEENDGPITPRVHVRFDPDEQEEERRAAAKKKKQKKQKSANIGTAAGLIIFFALVAALVIAIIYFSEEARNISESAVTARTTAATEPEPEISTRPAVTTVPFTSAPTTEVTAEKLMLPNFVGRFFNNTLKNRYSMLVFETEEEYSDEFAEGIIMEQDISENTQVTAGTTVHLKVSKGAAFTYLPDYIGMKLSDYTDKLIQLGVRYETAAEETNEVKQGYVVKCSKEIGDRVYISENEMITVYYAVKPAETEPPVPDDEIPLDDNDNDEVEEVISDEE